MVTRLEIGTRPGRRDVRGETVAADKTRVRRAEMQLRATTQKHPPEDAAGIGLVACAFGLAVSFHWV